MAETKKKQTAKKTTKKAPAKKTTAKKTVAKKTATKKTSVAAKAKKGSVKKSAAAKTKAKPVKSTPKKTDSSKKSTETEEPKSNTWMIVATVLAILIVLLVITIGAVYKSDTGTNVTTPDVPANVEINMSTENIQLVIVEDPACENCQVDTFAEQVKMNLIPDLEVQKVSFDSQLGEQIIKSVAAKQVPIYLFTENFDQRDDWINLSGAFVPSVIGDNKFYMLNPQFVPTKVMIESPTITDTAIVIGDADAPVTVIEFTDFECPYCAIAEGNEALVEQFKAQYPTYVAPIPEVLKEYVDAGKVKIVFYNNPIANLHPQARETHLAGLCANEQDMFEEYSHELWADRDVWTKSADRNAQYKTYASDLGLDTAKFDECLDTKKYNAQIDEELELGMSYGVSGTPAFFVGKSFISGAQDYTVFKELIDAQLTE
jgi:protein-disulfide isomerase